jgi:hypothetical protein
MEQEVFTVNVRGERGLDVKVATGGVGVESVVDVPANRIILSCIQNKSIFLPLKFVVPSASHRHFMPPLSQVQAVEILLEYQIP